MFFTNNPYQKPCHLPFVIWFQKNWLITQIKCQEKGKDELHIFSATLNKWMRIKSKLHHSYFSNKLMVKRAAELLLFVPRFKFCLIKRNWVIIRINIRDGIVYNQNDQMSLIYDISFKFVSFWREFIHLRKRS